jgi:FMN reductase
MAQRIKVIGIGGSLSTSSNSRTALKVALEGAVERGSETELFDVRELDLPIYDPGARHVPPNVTRLVQAVAAADGLIWSSPLYHGTISGAFKNALDWLELLAENKYLNDKVVGLVSTAAGSQGLQAVNTMEFVVRALRGWAVPLVLPIAKAHLVFGADGTIHDLKIAEQLRALGREVARAAAQFVVRAAPEPTLDG